MKLRTKLIFTRLRAVLRRGEVEREMDEELRFHIQMRARENVRRGMGAEEARRAAERSFGDLRRVKESCRDVKGGGFMETFLQDARYGARTLLKNRGFAAAAVIVLALGIGSNTAIFSVVNAVLLRPLPFEGQERLVVVWKRDAAADNPFVELSAPEAEDWRSQNGVFESLAAMPTTVYGYGYTVTGRGEPFQIESARVSADFFRTLGAPPALGRTFEEADDRPGAERIVVLGHRFWRDHFNADPGAVGQQVTFAGTNYTVVGVMPAEFEFPKGVEVWTPLRATMNQRTVENRGAVFLQAVGRLKPNVTVAQAEAELNTIVGRLAEQYPETEAKHQRVVITPLANYVFGDARPALHLLLAASALLLLIACVNIANLLLARATVRHREFALRAALGASRGRLVRQLLTESVVLAAAGGACGILLAHWLVRLLVSLAPADIPRLGAAAVDAPAVAFACVATLLTAAVFGITPALSASRINLGESLKEGTMKVAGGGGRLRGALVVAEVAVTLVLLIGAALILRSFINLRQVPLGFEPRNVLTVQLSLQGEKYRDVRERRDFFRNLIERLEAQPGVEAAGAVLIRPLEGKIGWDMPYAAEGQTPDDVRRNPVPNFEVITPHYFRAMGIPLVRGRDFSEGDTEQAPSVVIISDSMARRVFGAGADPLGRRLKIDPADPESDWHTVVGVAGDVRYRELTGERFDIYVPYRQSPVNFRYLTVRTASDPAAFIPVVRREVAALDRTQAVTDALTMEQLLARSLARPRFSTLLLGLFAVFAAVLACVGIYGMMTYTVTQRTREIGIRIALGAQSGDVLKMVVGRGLKLALAGVALGLVGALALTRAISGLLYGVGAADPPTFVGVALLLTGVALLACLVPARRASKVDPLVALKYE